ncbi:Tetratricopeptide repeat protein [uncultured Gammaproteobacteria bacterium]
MQLSQWFSRRGGSMLVLSVAVGGLLALVATIHPELPAAQDVDIAEPSPAAGNYLAGRFAHHANDWRAASDYITAALVRDPDDINLLRRAFVLKLGEGKLEAALPLARRLVVQDSDPPFALMLLAAEDAVAGNWGAATEKVNSLPGEGPPRYAKPLLAAWTVAAQGHFAEAKQVLEPLAKINGLTALHGLHAGLISELSGDSAEAERWYGEAMRGAGIILRVVQAAAGFQRRSGHPDQARALYDGLRKEFPDNDMIEPELRSLERGEVGDAVASTPRDGMAEALFDLASALHQEGSEEIALLYTRVALYLRPAFPLAQLLVGDVLAVRDTCDEALVWYQGLNNDPGLGWTARMRATECLLRLDRNDEALALLEVMATEQPTRSDPLIRIGDLHRSAKRFELAVAAYDRALTRVTTLGERHWPLFYDRAVAYDRSNRWPQAEADLLRAMELGPDQAVLLNYIGYSWVDRNVNLPKARAMIERAVALRPRDGYIIDSLGWALYRMSDYTTAVTHLERAIELKPVDPTINDHLGDAYWAVGRYVEALFQWRRALQYSDEQELTDSVKTKLTRQIPPRRTAAAVARPTSPLPTGAR